MSDYARWGSAVRTAAEWLSVAVLSTAVFAQDDPDALTKDELLFMDVPMVVTAARREQPATEAPATVYVLTAEDIKACGARTIPDALRMVPGIDVIALSVRNQTVAVRGLVGDPYNSKLLVMIDGRSEYWDVYGTVLWETLPLTMNEIERIEIIRGPGSSLYGSSAYAGIINIITRSGAQIGGAEISMVGGEYGTLKGTALYGFGGKKLSLKVAAEVDQTDEWRGSGESAGDITRMHAGARYAFSDEGSMSVSGGMTRTQDMKFFADETAGTFRFSGVSGFVQLDAEYGTLRCRALYKQEDYSATPDRLDFTADWLHTLIDIDIQHGFELGKNNSVVWGGSYRSNSISPNEYTPKYHQQNLFGFFIDDEMRLGKLVRLGLGARYDWHPLSGSQFSPRASVTFTPVPSQQVRLSGGTAYRNPTFIDSYIDFVAYSDTNMSVRVVGNEELKAEQLVSAELTYSGQYSRRFRGTADLFYRRYLYLRGAVTNAYLQPTPDGGTSLEVISTLKDVRDAHGMGGEVSLDFAAAKWLKLFGNYSLQYLFTTNDGAGEPLAESQSPRLYESTPRHKCNIGFTASLGGFRAGAYLHWSDKTIWSVNSSIPGGSPSTDTLASRFLLNGSIGYVLRNAEISVAVFNLFNREYYEYPAGENPREPSSDPLRQKVTVQITCRF